MPIKTGEYLDTKDIYIDYPYEGVMFKRTCADGKINKKFYGKEESKSFVNFDNNLYTEALLTGVEITKEIYDKGCNQ